MQKSTFSLIRINPVIVVCTNSTKIQSGLLQTYISLFKTVNPHTFPTTQSVDYSTVKRLQNRTHSKHGPGLLGQRDVVDSDSEAKCVGEVDGPVHRVYRTVSDVEQGGGVIEAQIPDKHTGGVGWGGGETSQDSMTG